MPADVSPVQKPSLAVNFDEGPIPAYTSRRPSEVEVHEMTVGEDRRHEQQAPHPRTTELVVRIVLMTLLQLMRTADIAFIIALDVLNSPDYYEGPDRRYTYVWPAAIIIGVPAFIFDVSNMRRIGAMRGPRSVKGVPFTPVYLDVLIGFLFGIHGGLIAFIICTYETWLATSLAIWTCLGFCTWGIAHMAPHRKLSNMYGSSV